MFLIKSISVNKIWSSVGDCVIDWYQTDIHINQENIINHMGYFKSIEKWKKTKGDCDIPVTALNCLIFLLLNNM